MQGLQKQVGARIRALRERKGLSQEALADVCQLHRTYVGLIERGQRNLSLSTLEVLAGGLEVAVAEIFADLKQPVAPGGRPAKSPKISIADIEAHLATLRQLLIDARLTDAQRYDRLVRANRRKF